MVNETAEQRAERYLREARSVSGGKDNNPPDRYDIVQLTGNLRADIASLNASADQGFRVDDAQPEIFNRYGYVLMNGYTEKK
jgi:hypothetical protein